jgi:hypothetical protein
VAAVDNAEEAVAEVEPVATEHGPDAEADWLQGSEEVVAELGVGHDNLLGVIEASD